MGMCKQLFCNPEINKSFLKKQKNSAIKLITIDVFIIYIQN